MPHKSAKFLTAVLASTGLVVSPLAAQAGQMGHFGTVPSVPMLRCPEVPQGHPGMNRSIVINHPVTTNIENNVNVYKPTNIENNVNIYKPVTINNNIDNSKNISIYKPINVTTNIDNSKNIEINKSIDNSKNINITKNIDNSKNINASKNININKNVNINKNIVINKGGSEEEALAIALAAAVAAASSSSSSSAVVNFNGSANASANASANNTASSFANSFSNSASFNNSGFFGNFGVSSYVAEAPGFGANGGGGNVNVEVSAAPQACIYQEATVIKAIHAICVSEDHHEFPASHMVEDSWIRAGYEGELARCLPGSSLKVTIGSVVQSSQGAAVSTAHGETLMCAPHEALRYYKGGLLKCAPAVRVPDCTERTNLRKYGTGDMFFSYATQVCLETGQEMVGGQSREVAER